MAKAKPAKSLAILGRTRRTGRWRLVPRSTVLVVFGACYLDMRNSFVVTEDDDDDDDEEVILKMKVTTFCGSATFLLPEGAEVKPSGMSLLGASTVDVPEHEDASELPTLEIEWTSVLSRFRILTDRSRDELEQVKEDKHKSADAAIGAIPPPAAVYLPQGPLDLVAQPAPAAAPAPALYVPSSDPAPVPVAGMYVPGAEEPEPTVEEAAPAPVAGMYVPGAEEPEPAAKEAPAAGSGMYVPGAEEPESAVEEPAGMYVPGAEEPEPAAKEAPAAGSGMYVPGAEKAELEEPAGIT